jgi:hypothetical protein
MFQSNTVFIVGAGASAEANLPTGVELTEQIAKLINLHVEMGSRVEKGDHRIFDALKALVQNDDGWRNNKLIASGREVAEAMELAPSIDTFLETHASNREFTLLGKLGIARAISMSERGSLFASSRDWSTPFRMREVLPTWYVSLARQLFAGVPVERPAIALENVSFIVFNYDRCLQIFLRRALMEYFRIDLQTAQEIVKSATFVHPYGSLGSPFPGEAAYVAFGDEDFDLVSASQRIKTYSETVESSTAALIKQMIENAETLVFLGFAFHQQNMNLLETTDQFKIRSSAAKRIFATTYNFSESDKNVVANMLKDMYLSNDQYPERPDQLVFTHNGKCVDLFSSYWRSLTN